MAKVTIEDISVRTGLSRGTISRALNNRPDISERTRQRVLCACQELNYVPSQAARALATGRNFTVLVLLEHIHLHRCATYLRGVLRRAQSEQYAVTVAELADVEQARARLASAAYERIDALLFDMPLQPGWSSTLAGLEGRTIVAVDGEAALVHQRCAPDYEAAGALAVRGLDVPADELLVLADLREWVGQRLLSGVQAELRARGAKDWDGALDTQGAGLAELLERGPLAERVRRAGAIIVENDAMAAELMLLAPRLGRVVGEDLALMGIGHEPLGQRVSPTLTTIDMRYEELGFQAMDAALRHITSPESGTAESICLPPRLELRESSRLSVVHT